MATSSIESLEADRQALVAICEALTDEQWESPSGCQGWRTQDVVAHMGALFWMVVDPSQLPDTSSLLTEAAQDVFVASRKDWSAEQVLEDYTAVSSKAIEQLAGLAVLDMEIPLGDLGTYKADLMPAAYAFDHYTHIRADMHAPRGSLTTTPPASDALRVGAALEWVVAALPQQNTETVAGLTGSVELVVEGPGGRTLCVGSGDTVATVNSDGPSFVRWITQRGAWDDLGVKASGDPGALDRVRSLKVF